MIARGLQTGTNYFEKPAVVVQVAQNVRTTVNNPRNTWKKMDNSFLRLYFLAIVVASLCKHIRSEQ